MPMKLAKEPKEQVIFYMDNLHNNTIDHVLSDRFIPQHARQDIINGLTENYDQTISNLLDFGDLSVKDYQIERLLHIQNVKRSIKETLDLLGNDVHQLLMYDAINNTNVDVKAFWESMEKYMALVLADLDTISPLI